MSNRYFEDKVYQDSGLFGIYAPGEDVARLTYYGLLALQHRGQDGAGIAVSDGKKIQLYKNKGLVTKVFSDNHLNLLKGNLAIGHVCHGIFGETSAINAKPKVSSKIKGGISLAHNGRLTNSFELRGILKACGSNLETKSDSEIILKLINHYWDQQENSLLEAIKRSLKKIKGTYSIAIMTEKQVIGIRDPKGVRPLWLGKFGEGYVLASESCAFDTIGAQFIRDIRPGELVLIDSDGLKSIQISNPSQHNHCSFEYIYFARQDSILEGSLVDSVRRTLGSQLASECPIDADMVVPVPDSGMAAASGYAKQLGLPLGEGLVKNRYVGRTLIQAQERLREQALNLKFNPVRDMLKGRKVVLVDDSIVSGDTTRHIVKLLRASGVKEVHLLVSSPPFRYPCYYGIDITSSNQLIAAQYSLAEIKRCLGVDGLHYLSLAGLLEALQPFHSGICTACFTGDYCIEIPNCRLQRLSV